jgi:membrane-associated HD superfamily phosphohydrolase
MKAHKGGRRLSRMDNKVPVKAKKHSLRSVSKQRTRDTGRTILKKSDTKLRPRQRLAAVKSQFTGNKNKNKNNKKMTTKALTHLSKITRDKAKAVKKVRMARRTRIVRIMGHGQFTVDNKTLRELSRVDSSIVQLVSSDRPDDTEFKKRLSQLTKIVEMTGKPLSPNEIIQSDIILPSVDLSIDEAKKLFKGEGVVPVI